MGTSTFFNNYRQRNEQRLIEDLYMESIKIFGVDFYYIPRVIENKDELYGEDTISSYRQGYSIEMYIKNVDGFEGDGNFMSKFGLEIRNQITLTISVRRFQEEVPQFRPNEGDLIWFSLSENRPQLYVVKYVNIQPLFFQLGTVHGYDMVCEVFEYSNERFETGIPEIDNIQTRYSTDTVNAGVATDDEDLLTGSDGLRIISGDFDYEERLGGDIFSDNEYIQEKGQEILDFDDKDPFSEGNY